MTNTALIIGVSGIVGSNLARHLIAQPDWTVAGVSRSTPPDLKLDAHYACDLTDREDVMSSLAAAGDVTHVFFSAWKRHDTEQENIDVNTPMLQNTLDGVCQNARLSHAALVTGTKHYLGPFESYGQSDVRTPYRETQPRLDFPNFYYNQEDALFAMAEKHGFTWSVHRPHTMIGYAVGGAMNLGVTVSIYAAICKETDRPFLFPGSETSYRGLVDCTDARLLAKQLEWAATTPEAANKPFNVVNGDIFRWEWMWKKIGDYFGLDVPEYPGHPQPLEEQMAGAEKIWTGMVAKYGLTPHPLDRLCSWWHTDGDLGRELEAVNDMSNSRELGFCGYMRSENSFTDLFDDLKRRKIIPDF